MTTSDVTRCTSCGGALKYYDKVRRIVRTKGGSRQDIYVERFRCVDCHTIRRQLPGSIFPYKHYDSEIIKGVLEGFINPSTIGYEDYPCEMTMKRWVRENIIPYYEEK